MTRCQARMIFDEYVEGLNAIWGSIFLDDNYNSGSAIAADLYALWSTLKGARARSIRPLTVRSGTGATRARCG